MNARGSIACTRRRLCTRFVGILQARDCQEKAERKCERVTVINIFEKKTLKKSIRGVGGEVVHYMQVVPDVLQEQVRLSSGPNDVIFWPEDADAMLRLCKGHAMNVCTYG